MPMRRLDPHSQPLSTTDDTHMRTIETIHTAVDTPMGDLSTWMALPFGRDQHMDPFLLLNHHGPQHYTPGSRGLPFEPHPHRGFETLTFVVAGDVVHRDSTGSESVIGAGGIQWMTAGRGIIHEEISSEEFQRSGGDVEVLQLWMNLPARLKMVEPKYVGLQANEIPVATDDGGRIRVHVISGDWDGVEGPVQSLTHLFTSWIDMDAGASLETHVTLDRRVLLYVVRGELEVNGQRARTHQLVVFGASDDVEIRIEALADSMFLFCHGAPYEEPIVARGPFVMNTHQEILQAFEDYHEGRM